MEELTSRSGLVAQLSCLHWPRVIPRAEVWAGKLVARIHIMVIVRMKSIGKSVVEDL